MPRFTPESAIACEFAYYGLLANPDPDGILYWIVMLCIVGSSPIYSSPRVAPRGIVSALLAY